MPDSTERPRRINVSVLGHDCEECAPGNLANDTGSTDYAVCYSGPFAPFTGSSVCQECDAGTFAVHSFNEVSMQCDIMECATGYLANDTGSTDCAVCYSGSVAPFIDGMKVDNDRLGQLRGLGRHESPPSISTDLTVFTQIMQVSRLKALSRVVNVYFLPRQLDEKVAKFTFRHSARSSPSTSRRHRASRGLFRLPQYSPRDRVGFKPIAELDAPLASFLHDADAAQLYRYWKESKAYKTGVSSCHDSSLRKWRN